MDPCEHLMITFSLLLFRSLWVLIVFDRIFEKVSVIIRVDKPCGARDQVKTTYVSEFLIDHPKFLKNSLYLAGISYTGVVLPKITLEIYEGNERGDQPALNIQGYILCSPLTHKFNDFNSRLEYAHRLALISDDIYKSATEYCNGNYVNVDSVNSVCAASLQRYEEDDFTKVVTKWANMDVVQHALDVRQGKIGKWELINNTMHYQQGKNDTSCYSYDIFSSFSYHKQLTSKKCRALILSGDHDMTFPYVGVERWITSLNLGVEVPWKPYYVDGQVGGYDMKYALNDYSLTFATLKGAGHLVPADKPKETIVLWEAEKDNKKQSNDLASLDNSVNKQKLVIHDQLSVKDHDQAWCEVAHDYSRRSCATWCVVRYTLESVGCSRRSPIDSSCHGLTPCGIRIVNGHPVW
ncbi:Peptidase S10, serine carboxypeptidase [Artemisia annua]|uniref:Peptidase S10, serine carboxypeptidase n=1 Tax=Artemisia annua TaxID=35608 RepID=A0A2U1L124_ARTAN|nr:Peptidase S10, serine carboxypeptidase [Artemisia annua]